MAFSTEKILQKEQRQISFRRLFQRIFLDDWVVKALALAITFALWLGVTGLRTPTRERLRNISLAVRVSNDIEITNSPVQEVDLVVTGDKRKIDQIKREDLIVSLDLTDAQPGDRTVKISPENVTWPTAGSGWASDGPAMCGPRSRPRQAARVTTRRTAPAWRIRPTCGTTACGWRRWARRSIRKSDS